jgi:hypothetical protein
MGTGMGIDKRIGVPIIALIVLVLYFSCDARRGGFPQCPFHRITGLYCPGCGSQRALSALLHGDIIEAFHDNILMVLFLPLLLYSAWMNLRYAGIQKMRLWYDPVFVKIVLMTVICFSLFRNIPFYPFSMLAPL